jgi:hypothetical protein
MAVFFWKKPSSRQKEENIFKNQTLLKKADFRFTGHFAAVF